MLPADRGWLVTISPPEPAQPGSPYILSFSFYDYETGVLTDPTSLTLDITYGLMAGLTADYAGSYTYTGASAPAPEVIWRTGVGTYQFWWDVPAQGTLPGIYVANWSAQYGPLGDMFMAVENFPVLTGGLFVPVPSGDTGFWTGSLTYQPSWATSPFVISFGATDSNGITWLWKGITGWDSPPTAGTGVIQRSADHGGWPAPQFYGPRIITLTVMASAPSQALRDLARAQLEQVVPPGGTSGDLATLQYNEPVPKTAQVRRNSGAQITETYPTLSDVEFSIPLVAPDPRKYATPPQSAGLVIPAPSSNPLTLPFSLPVSFPGNIPPSSTAVTAYNTGTFETRPTLTVTGPITSPSVVNAATAQQISFTGLTLAGTDLLVLDTDNRQAQVNGSFYPADVSSAWFVLQPGATQIYLDGITTGGASLTVVYSPAYV